MQAPNRTTDRAKCRRARRRTVRRLLAPPALALALLLALCNGLVTATQARPAAAAALVQRGVCTLHERHTAHCGKAHHPMTSAHARRKASTRMLPRRKARPGHAVSVSTSHASATPTVTPPAAAPTTAAPPTASAATPGAAATDSWYVDATGDLWYVDALGDHWHLDAALGLLSYVDPAGHQWLLDPSGHLYFIDPAGREWYVAPDGTFWYAAPDNSFWFYILPNGQYGSMTPNADSSGGGYASPDAGSSSDPRWNSDAQGNWVTSLPGVGTDRTIGYVDGCVMVGDESGGTGC